jgi:small-conductance mechanosensitive channel
LNTEAFLQNTQLWNSLLALGLVVFLTFVLKGAFNFLISRLQKLAQRTSGKWDDILLYGFAGTKIWAIFIWLSAAALPVLKFHESVNQAGRQIAILATAIQVMIWGLRAVGRWRDDFLEEKAGTDTSSVAAIGLLSTFIQCMLVVLLALLALSNLGIDVGALVAGLGIGGIAIALAAQNVLGDLLASLSIVLDKPFVVGDFIVVGDKSGTVSHIGVKTTRLTSLTGEQLVFSNKILLESQIQNFKRMSERRALIKVGVTYSTNREKLGKIPIWIKALVEEIPKVRFERCHFTGFGSSSLDFELVFYAKSPEYNDFADNQEEVLYKIFDKFIEEGIDFAFPSTSLYIEKSASTVKT